MNFLNRLKYYLFGVGLGILLVMAIFKDRKLTSWTPRNQVMKEIKNKELILSDKNSECLKCLGFNTKKEIIDLLLSSNIDFGKSEVENHDERLYMLTFEDTELYKITVSITEDNVELTSINTENSSCVCQ